MKYTKAFKQKVVAALNNGITYKEVQKQFGVPLSTAFGWKEYQILKPTKSLKRDKKQTVEIKKTKSVVDKDFSYYEILRKKQEALNAVVEAYEKYIKYEGRV